MQIETGETSTPLPAGIWNGRWCKGVVTFEVEETLRYLHVKPWVHGSVNCLIIITYNDDKQDADVEMVLRPTVKNARKQ